MYCSFLLLQKRTKKRALTYKEGTSLRDNYSVRYYCQSGEEKAATFPLNNDEQKQLDDIVIKLLNNGVRLGISFTPVSDILIQLNEAK